MEAGKIVKLTTNDEVKQALINEGHDPIHEGVQVDAEVVGFDPAFPDLADLKVECGIGKSITFLRVPRFVGQEPAGRTFIE